MGMEGENGPRVRIKSFFQKTLEVPGGALGVGLAGVDGRVGGGPGGGEGTPG